MPADEDREAGTAAAAALLIDLENDSVEDHGVVARDGAGLLVAEDLVEVHAAERDEG